MSTRRKPIKASQMNLPVNIQQQADVEDDRGGVKKGWVVLWPDVFVELTSKTLTSLDAGGQLVTAVKHTMRTRWIPNIIPGMRIDNYTYGVFYRITDVIDPLGTGEELELVAVEVVGKS